MNNYKAIKLSIILLSLLFLFMSSCGCTSIADYSFNSKTIEIKEGFSDGLKKTLKDEYDLEIPDSAVFKEGSMYFSFRDSDITLRFRIAEEDLAEMFLYNWEDTQYNNTDPDEFITYGAKSHFDKNAILLYEEPKNGLINIYIFGDIPQKTGNIK